MASSLVNAGKAYFSRILNSYLGPYFENFNKDQLAFGLSSGKLTLTNLRVKKSALDKFDLPVECVEGRVGLFSVSIPWFSLGRSPVVIRVEDVHVVIGPSKSTNFDPEDFKKRANAVKMEKLERAEAMNFGDSTDGESSSWGFFGIDFQTLVSGILNNLQVYVNNVHFRYEDTETVPGHTFAAGLTLSTLSAITTGPDWKPAVVEAKAASVHKLAELKSLAFYFDTDVESIVGLGSDEGVRRFRELIASDEFVPKHQYVLKPVNGQGRFVMNSVWGEDVPQYELELPFDEIAFTIDKHQYRDLISVADVQQIRLRQHEYRKYRPPEAKFHENRSRALFSFAAQAIRAQIHERRATWSWENMRQRRDDRRRYLVLFPSKLIETLSETDAKELEEIEKKYNFDTLSLFRKMARTQMKRDKVFMAQLEARKKRKKQQSSWTNWIWGSSAQSSSSPTSDDAEVEPITDEQKKELYEIFDVDEKAALAKSFEKSEDSIKFKASAQLKQGSMTLRRSPHEDSKDILSLFFDGFQAGFIKRIGSLDLSAALGNFRVFDDTTPNTLYRQIVHVKESESTDEPTLSTSMDAFGGLPYQPFFYFKFEQKPKNSRADSALSVYMRSMEIIYHKGYVEATYQFFKPPENQLQSVEALLSAAGQTLENIQKETRAGLEFALETHKTVDLHMNIHAPVIIIPESIVEENCNHLVIDAGQVLVDSALVSKKDIQEIDEKRKQQYTDEDYRRLESLMYDVYNVQLKSAQFVMGHNLEACRVALKAETVDNKLHLLERINIDLIAKNSIVPTVRGIPRMKVSAKLPNLHVNFSDSKYKTLIHLLDVTIPHFDDDAQQAGAPQFSGPLFERPSTDDETGYDSDDETPSDLQKSSTSIDLPAIRQVLFEFSFQVDSLQATLLRSGDNDHEKPIGSVHLDRFSLQFSNSKFAMNVGVRLRSISVFVFKSEGDPLKLVSTEKDASKDTDLMTVEYNRVQAASPDYLSKYEGMDQSVNVALSTFVLQADPEPLLDLYDFIMTTFVPSQQAQSSNEGPTNQQTQPSNAPQATNEQKIGVRVKLASFEVLLQNGPLQLATLALSTATLSVTLFGNHMQVTTSLGDVLLTDDSLLPTKVSDFKKILSIEGSEAAELRYETFDLGNNDDPTRVNSSVVFKAGALKLVFLEKPMHDLYVFFMKFAKLKSLYDAARMAAVQRAAEIERMGFDVSVSSPIVIFPFNPQDSEDKFTVRLGEVTAKNSFNGALQKIAAALSGIQLTSTTLVDHQPSTLKIVDDVTISAEVEQTQSIDRSKVFDSPDIHASVKISDVKLYLTQLQYCSLLSVAQSIPRVLQIEESSEFDRSAVREPIEAEQTKKDSTLGSNLQPELDLATTSSGQKVWTSIDLVVNLQVVKIHLYDAQAVAEGSLKDHGIARFAINGGTLNFKMLSDNAMEAELTVKSFTMSNTKPGQSKHREIIPAANHDRNQLMVLITMSGGGDPSTVAIVTVDSPQIIFSLDPIFALSNFFLSAFQAPPTESTDPQPDAQAQNATQSVSSTSALTLRFDLHDASICILEDDNQADSQAVRLSVKQLSLSHQRIIALTISRLGLSLMRMGKQSDSVKILDDVDLSLSLSLEDRAARQFTNIEVDVQPVVFRTSYRDINLMTTIVNDAIARLPKNGETNPDTKHSESSMSKPMSTRRASGKTSNATSVRRTAQEASVIVSTEKLHANFEGFRLVLISDLHELPMLHLQSKPFIFVASDWSTKLQASTSISTSITYWNLKNSHWEPFIDPWTFSMMVSKESESSATSVTLHSNELLDMNVSSSFVELAIATAKVWSSEGDNVLQRARGSYPPYRISNRTGGAVFIWSDIDGSRSASDYPAAKISSGETVDWRFDDWKSARESVSSSGYNAIGIQFDGKPWEQLRSVPVDKEGQYTYSLRPKTDKITNKLMCEISIKDNVKIVTLRSTYKVENQTLYPLELTLVDNSGHPVYPVEKIAPGNNYAIPIEAVTQTRLRIQPDQGFGYRWSPPIKWEDLGNVRQSGLTIRCPHVSQNEAPFRFQIWPVKDMHPLTYPQITLNLRAPIELENLLPYNVQYKIYDRDTDQNWSSYLRKGGIMPVHSVELGHLVLLSVTAQDTTFKASEFAIINSDGKSDFDVEQQLTLSDGRDRKLELRLNYIKYPQSGGAFKVQIYCPYIIVNKTGVPFSVKSVNSRTGLAKEIPGQYTAEELTKTTPIMFSHPQKKNHDFIFKLGDSIWSQPISLEAPSAESALSLRSNSSRNELQVGISWAEGLGKYKLTKVVTLAPRFFICNKLDRAIQFREHTVAPERPELAPGERSPILFLRGEEHLLTLAYPGLDAQWCPAFKIEDIGTVHVRMSEPGSPDRKDAHLVAVDILIEQSNIFINICPHEGPWPFVIENESDFEVSFGQADAVHERPEQSNLYKLQPHSRMSYAWDFPSADDKKIYIQSGNRARRIDIMEIGVLPPLKLHQTPKALSLDVRADGQAQILSITNYREEESLYKLKRQDSGTLSRRSSIATTQGLEFEAVEETVPLSLIFKLEMKGLGISLMNKKLVEVVYLSLRDLNIEYTSSSLLQSVTVSCGMLQVDNQLHDAQFPVVLQPTPIPKDLQKVAALPAVQASVVLMNDNSHGVLFVKYASILLQAITIQLDEAFLYAVLDLTKLQGVDWEAESENVLIEHPDTVPEPVSNKAGQVVYFEVLELQPIILSVSFMRNFTPPEDDAQKLTSRNPLAVALNVLTMTLGNLGDARLELNALGLKDARLTIPDLEGRIFFHYRQEVLRQLYRILGSADFLGNPVGLFTNVSSGVADIFYEPWRGVVQHGGSELGVGIAKGAASFMKKTIFGFSDSVTKVTSSLGKGLSAATLDSEYQSKRRQTQRRNKPRHAIYGVTAGAEAFANSVASGVEGVLMKPLEGAEAEGAVGFLKGIGKGLVGVVTKPAVGVFDLASNVSEGIRNTTTVFDAAQRDRVRKPRHVPADGVLQPYSSRAAIGQFWLKDLENGTYKKEYYMAHIDIPGGDNVVLLTTNRVLSFSSRKLRLMWDMPFSTVQGVTIENTGIRFVSKAGKEQDRFVYIQSQSSIEWFFNEVANVVKGYNARRRLER
ncbi:hypothetical protein SCHPADRAFT_996578 [Schizopora paradoxa]|uniref:Vacuolar protein sorting-associated protein n=1 Tax=Schizopora paradoxa TaxID=27342 RepID=A0A0H2RSB0_9AGAM|nr:hypothetical protein SCHPADRAFT_996578 [Schizopora paradoxa]